jgi:hypothetical protein
MLHANRKYTPNCKLDIPRDITLNLIESPHDTQEDTDYILAKLNGFDASRTLFVEQGSPSQKDHYVNHLLRLAEADPEITEDFQRRRDYTWSSLDQYETSPFAIASQYVKEKGGKVVNFDLSSNFSDRAIDFLIRTSSIEYAIEIIYDEVRDACFDYQETIPKVFKKIFPDVSGNAIDAACEALYETYHRIDISMNRFRQTLDFWNYLRETFMFETLEQFAGEGDYVVCHPNHAREIIKLRSEIIVPSTPYALFQLGE